MDSSVIQTFPQEIMNSIFKLDIHNPFRLSSRESSWLEFKETFNWDSRDKYAKTMASFANTKGGYITFGIKDRPREIVGLQNENFENINQEKITAFLNSAFSPEIEWDIHVYSISGKKVGLIYVHQSGAKPVICIKNCGQELKESDIYYRYRGKSERIRYPELKAMLEAEREKEKRLWMKHLERISRIGAANIGIFDTVKGDVAGPGGAFLISENLLPKLNFIKKGKLSPTEGVPTLRLVGDVKPINEGIIQPIKKVIQHRAIHTPDIVNTFLDQSKVNNPLEYIKQICYETTAYLPVYHFIKQSGLSKNNIVTQIANITSRYPSKNKLIKRLKSEENFCVRSLNTGTIAAKKKRKFIDKIWAKKLPDNIPKEDLKYFFQSIAHISFDDFDWKYLFPVMKQLFSIYYGSLIQSVAGEMRKAICHLDYLTFRRGKLFLAYRTTPDKLSAFRIMSFFCLRSVSPIIFLVNALQALFRKFISKLLKGKVSWW